MTGLPYPLNKRLSGCFVGFLKVAEKQVYAGAAMVLLVWKIYANLLQTKEAHQRFQGKESGVVLRMRFISVWNRLNPIWSQEYVK